MDSRIPNFYDLDPEDRLKLIRDERGLDIDFGTLQDGQHLDVVDRLSENVIGSIEFPMSIATNFVIDGRDVLVPMAIEESSVVAAASHGAKLARSTGGFETSTTGPYMIGQVQVRDVSDPNAARTRILERATDIKAEANDQGV
ncbi:MAG: 3-hydroxy-3-methylglutaryl-CoA reductase, partial [Halobacteriaceae archaeon]